MTTPNGAARKRTEPLRSRLDVPSPAATSASRERLFALDVFRGATVAALLLVNNPGSWSAIYAPLQHAPWRGWTPSDLTLPFLLFIVGITTAIATSARRARGVTDRELVRLASVSPASCSASASATSARRCSLCAPH